MSKPKHYMRRRGWLARYGIAPRRTNSIKGALDYKSNLTNEIEELKPGGAHVAKLRKYLKRCQ